MVQVEDVSNWSARMREPMEAVYGVEGFPKLWFETENVQRKSFYLSVKLYIVGQIGAKLTSRFGKTGVTFAATRLTFLP